MSEKYREKEDDKCVLEEVTFADVVNVLTGVILHGTNIGVCGEGVEEEVWDLLEDILRQPEGMRWYRGE